MGIQYVARKPLKVDGRTIEPGEIVPEAASWKNVKAYVNDGSLALAVEVPEGAVENADLKAQVAALAARVGRLESLVVGEGETDGDLDVVGDVAAKPVTGPVLGLETGEPEAEQVQDLTKLKRAELNEIAASLNIERPEDLKNIPEVIEAIETARAEAANDGSDESEPE